MSFLFGSQKTPQISVPPTPPITKQSDQNAIIEEEKKKIRKGRTSRQTLMTGPQGLLEPAPVSKKVLLGE